MVFQQTPCAGCCPRDAVIIVSVTVRFANWTIDKAGKLGPRIELPPHLGLATRRKWTLPSVDDAGERVHFSGVQA